MDTPPRRILKVEIGGEERPVRFGWNALAAFARRAELPIAALGNLSNETIYPDHMIFLIWAGLADGARKEGKHFDATAEDVGDWMDDVDEGVIEEIMTLYAEAQETKKKPQKKAKKSK